MFLRTALHDYTFLHLVLLVDLPQRRYSWIVWIKLLASSYNQSLLLELLLPIRDRRENTVLQLGAIAIFFSLVFDLRQLHLFKVAYSVFVSPIQIGNVPTVL